MDGLTGAYVAELLVNQDRPDFFIHLRSGKSLTNSEAMSRHD